MTKNTAGKILDVAEMLMRNGGYNACSFREIAKIIRIKSASVHYHFPTKENLAIAVVQRYTINFIDKLEKISNELSFRKQLNSYTAIFQKALNLEEKTCLCGVLAAEIGSLPPNLKIEVQLFFKENLKWLVRRMNDKKISGAEGKAAYVLATLEGALLLNVSLEINKVFEKSVFHLKTLFPN